MRNIKELFITGAGVSVDSGIPTFRGNDGFWTIGSRNYTPQEMATRLMYENHPAEFLLWYYKRFVSFRNVIPNEVHHWLSKKKLITQNIDGLDGKAGNHDFIPIHGRLDKSVIFDDELKDNTQIDTDWETIDPQKNLNDEEIVKALMKKFKIPYSEGGVYKPVKGLSLKPFLLLFDEIYTDLYRISEAQHWMEYAKKIIFIGTSFSVNITSIALDICIKNNVPITVVDPKPVLINYDRVEYHALSALEYCKMRES